MGLAVDVASSGTVRPMTTMLDITDIARATGLSNRALRFYEARGLIRPLRSGRILSLIHI